MISLERFRVEFDKPVAHELYWCKKNGECQATDFLMEELAGSSDQTKTIQRLAWYETNGRPRNPEQYRQLKRYENLHELKCDHVRLFFFVLGNAFVFTVGFRKDQQETPEAWCKRHDRLRLEYLGQLKRS